jgi:hypothetical protein
MCGTCPNPQNQPQGNYTGDNRQPQDVFNSTTMSYGNPGGGPISEVECVMLAMDSTGAFHPDPHYGYGWQGTDTNGNAWHTWMLGVVHRGACNGTEAPYGYKRGPAGDSSEPIARRNPDPPYSAVRPQDYSPEYGAPPAPGPTPTATPTEPPPTATLQPTPGPTADGQPCQTLLGSGTYQGGTCR